MKFIQPQESTKSVQRSFLIYGEPKAGKTSLALSMAELGKTVFVATEKDGWQDAYHNLSPKSQNNVQIVEIESIQDIKMVPLEIAKLKDVAVVVVDSFTAFMSFIESQIKGMGGKHVVGGITNKLSLQSYGDLANVAIDFLQALKATGKHIVLTAGMDTEKIENSEGIITRRTPLMTGSKTSTTLPYEVRAIGFLRSMNGKRELWFQASPQWLAGTNYQSLTNAKVVEDPTFAKIFALFPKKKPNASTTDTPKEPAAPTADTAADGKQATLPVA